MATVAPRARPLLAWAVWATLLAVDAAYVAIFGDQVPFWDDWELVPQLTGGRPVTLSWLWSPHNEHRIALPRLLHLGAVRLAGGDLRAPQVANVLLVAAAAAALLVAIRRLRGRNVAADATLPIVLMHPGHGEVLLWGIGLASTISTFLAAAAVACIAIDRRCSPLRAAIVAASCVGLVLSGATALPIVPPLLLWLAWAIRDEPLRAKIPAAPLALVAFAIWAAALATLARPAVHPPSAGVAASVRTALEFLAMGIGPSGRATWPLSGVAVALALGAAAGALARAIATQPDEHVRATGLLAALASFVGLACVVGWGRSGFGAGAGLATRYAVLAAPAVATAYLATTFLPAVPSRVAQTFLLAAACAAVPWDVKVGLDDGRLRSARGAALQADVDAGRAPHEIASRHVGTIYPEPYALERGLALLRMARLGPYRHGSTPRFPMFATTPYEVRSAIAVEPRTIAGEDGLLVHAPGVVRVRVRPGRWVLTVRFGLQPEAYVGGETDGVEFSGTLLASDGEHALFRRMLDPRHVEADRGFQTVVVRLAAPDGGDLVLRTLPGPAGDERWDWSVWTAIGLRSDDG
jgi:hypothetical protein